MSSVFKTVIKALPQLKPDELKQVRNYLDACETLSPNNSEDTWLLDGLVYELARRGLFCSDVQQQNLFKGYKRQITVLSKMLLAAVRFPVSSTQKAGLGKLVARAFADYFADRSDLSLPVLLQNLHALPVALDRSYPGYVAAGRLGALVKVEL